MVVGVMKTILAHLAASFYAAANRSWESESKVKRPIVLAHLGSLRLRRWCGSPPFGFLLAASVLQTLAIPVERERRVVAVVLPEPHVRLGSNYTLNFGRAVQPFGSDNPWLGSKSRPATRAAQEDSS